MKCKCKVPDLRYSYDKLIRCNLPVVEGTSFCSKHQPSPTPDPFEEWFRTVGVFIFDNPNGKYALARAAYDKGWDAAIKWKEEQ